MALLMLSSLLLAGGCTEPDETEAGVAAGESMSDNPGLAYLQQNAKQAGVVVTASGLQYEVLQEGTGKSPMIDDLVLTHYHGTLITGEVFDSSVDRGTPAQFPVSGVIKGWTEALQLMQEGDKWRLTVPSELAYGKRGAGSQIGPDTVLIFEVELLEVKSK